MTVADNGVDRPLVEVVIDAIDADDDLSDEIKYYVLAALEGPTALQEPLDGVSTPHAPESSADRTVEEPVGAFLKSIGVASFRGIGPKATLELHPAPGITVVIGHSSPGESNFADVLKAARADIRCLWTNQIALRATFWRAEDIARLSYCVKGRSASNYRRRPGLCDTDKVRQEWSDNLGFILLRCVDATRPVATDRSMTAVWGSLKHTAKISHLPRVTGSTGRARRLSQRWTAKSGGKPGKQRDSSRVTRMLPPVPDTTSKGVLTICSTESSIAMTVGVLGRSFASTTGRLT